MTRRAPRATERRAREVACLPTWASLGVRSAAVLEAPGLVAGLDDLAVMGETIEQRGRHFRVAEDARPFAEGEVGGDDDRGPLVEPADQMEQQLATGLGEGKIAQFIEDGEVEADDM